MISILHAKNKNRAILSEISPIRLKNKQNTLILERFKLERNENVRI
jgi:hypothetical protein